MTAALGAVLLFILIHSAVEVDFSAGYFLPFGFGAFAVINLTCGQLVPVPRLAEKAPAACWWASALCLAVFGVLLCMNMRAAVIASQRDYDAIAQAADLDPYEWADYKLSYVVSASAEDDLPDSMRDTMERYLTDLAALHSNSVPRYLARCYFNLEGHRPGLRHAGAVRGLHPLQPGDVGEQLPHRHGVRRRLGRLPPGRGGPDPASQRLERCQPGHDHPA